MKFPNRLIAILGALLLALPFGSAQATPTNVALGKTVIGTSYYNGGSEVFPYAAIVDGRTTDTGTSSNWSFWLSAGGQISGQWVQVDLGQIYSLSSIVLYDTHNRGYNDRGTQDYHVAVSSNGLNFTTVGTGTFTNTEWLNQLADTITLTTTSARYVRFYADTAYGSGSVGLAELQVWGDQVPASAPEPGTVALTLIGLALPALRRRIKR